MYAVDTTVSKSNPRHKIKYFLRKFLEMKDSKTNMVKIGNCNYHIDLQYLIITPSPSNFSSVFNEFKTLKF